MKTMYTKRERKSPDIAWFLFSNDYKNITQTKYNVTISNDMPDLLTKVTTLIFPDQETYDAWAVDPIVKAERDAASAHDTSHGIVKEIKYY